MMRADAVPALALFAFVAGCTRSSDSKAASSRSDSAVPRADSSAAKTKGEWAPAAPRLLTRWGSQLRPESVLVEYPRPQMTRARWQSLNGLWEFAIVDSSRTSGVSGDPHQLATPSRPGAAGPDGPIPAPPAAGFTRKILVPFAPEAALSGVGHHADWVAYRRRFERPAGFIAGERLLLHLDACDWHCTVYVNGKQVADHRGGYGAFTADVTDAMSAGRDQELVVAVYDPTDKFGQPRGKQVSHAEGIWYTPVTGIWQTVWLEPVSATSIDRLQLTPDVSNNRLRLVVQGRGTSGAQQVEAVALDRGKEIGRVRGAVGTPLAIAIADAHRWSPEDPYLYDLRVTLFDGGRAVDSVGSYFGMRQVSVGKDAKGFSRIALNGEPVFQLGPLDQGWWPDGLYTAPSDEALRSDIATMKSLGFNMVRKHIKVEPARWYYWADKLGLAVWQDMPSGWNDTPDARAAFERELREMVAQLKNVPSIVVWVPFNEKWGQFDTKRIVGIVQQLDSSRLVNDASGWQDEGAGQIIDVHRYQGPQAMRGTNGRVAVVGEFGGLGFKSAGHTWAPEGWGYSGLFSSRDSLADRYDLLVKRLYHDRDTHGIGAGVYTQLTDVEAELNGFMTYDRAETKFDTARVAATNRGWTPYVLPELTEFTDSVRVTISQGTPTEVHYTVDGSEPTATSERYTAPFTLLETHTVRARAFVNGQPTRAAESRMEYRKSPGRPAANADVAPGLHYDVYDETTAEPAYRMNWPVRFQVERPDVQAKDIPPRKSGVAAVPSIAVADTGEMFSMRFTGYVRVPRTGVYTFTALADDGAAMWVGDRNVFWSVGQSPKTTETWGQVALQSGLQPIVLTYFQGYGPKALELYIEGPGVSRQRVTAAMLFHDRAAGGAATR